MQIERMLVPLAIFTLGQEAIAQVKPGSEVNKKETNELPQKKWTKEMIRKKVIGVVSYKLGVPETRINDLSHYSNNLGGNSLDFCEIIL